MKMVYYQDLSFPSGIDPHDILKVQIYLCFWNDPAMHKPYYFLVMTSIKLILHMMSGDTTSYFIWY